jgi:hypothetical protein
MAIKPIALSFKNTPEDKDLYNWITIHSNMSGFIKDTLRAAKEKELSKNNVNLEEYKQENLIQLNF